uniref:Uncharacterized protein n=1 Tax=Dromaius novaehollandiae TaxID=8790 RepID=A0A8C4K9P2_DRONO
EFACATLIQLLSLFQCCSRTLAMSVFSQLEIQRAQPSVFSHLQVSHQEVQPNTPFRRIDTAASFIGFGSSVIGYISISLFRSMVAFLTNLAKSQVLTFSCFLYPFSSVPPPRILAVPVPIFNYL